ncbi:hypothetical protein A3860_25895 [Niastella vici]|uniref:Uncharacterized protein n=1 Tax=Niastella vici TaxID=1703345 RepID=A0A1V9FYB5_9BACT|nr:hypothetical protein [Niastella vici]OQP63324.1 hypothetical protein A3860_25895 [Niastella vici]
MMKSIVKKANSFISFDLPLEKAYIAKQFASFHKKSMEHSPEWSTTATRQKLIAEYWYTHVIVHFAVLFALPALVIIMISGGFTHLPQYLASFFVAGLLSFLVLYVALYRHYFTSFYLPQVETVKEEYERKVVEQLEKCRQAQLSNFALSLVFYVFYKTSGINGLQCNDHFARLQMKLFGVDQGSLKKSLELILGKKKGLTERKQTEIRHRFEEAYAFFEELLFPQGALILKELESKFQH